MGSLSSRPRSASSGQRDEVSRLLRDGAAIRGPSEAVRQVANLLQDLGLIEFVEQQYVRCADPEDRDFRFTRNRSCPGRVYLYQPVEESAPGVIRRPVRVSAWRTGSARSGGR